MERQYLVDRNIRHAVTIGVDERPHPCRCGARRFTLTARAGIEARIAEMDTVQFSAPVRRAATWPSLVSTVRSPVSCTSSRK